MASLTNKIAIFIDGPNLYATSKTLGFDVDFKQLLSEFGSRGKLLRSFSYSHHRGSGISVGSAFGRLAGYNGYTVVTKPTKEFVNPSCRRKIKANMNVELMVNSIELAANVDEMILFSGDSDFRSLSKLSSEAASA